jgi:hypothetical protein
MKAEAWEGGDPTFGRDEAVWLRRRIMAHVFGDLNPETGWRTGPDKLGWPPCLIDEFLDVYAAEDPLRFVEWIDNDTFLGEGFANGSWHLKPKAVDAFSKQALDIVDRAIDAREFPTLDEWLKADIDGTLCFRGEAGGMSLVSPELRDAIKAKRAERGDRRRCRACGEAFKADRANAKNCQPCRDRLRTEMSERAEARRKSRKERLAKVLQNRG